MFIFPVQLTTSRIGNIARLILTLPICDDHTLIHTYILYKLTLLKVYVKNLLTRPRSARPPWSPTNIVQYNINSMYVCMYVCMYVFIKLHITTQSGPVILVILCHSH